MYDWRQHVQSNGGRAGRRSGVIAGGVQIDRAELINMFVSPEWNIQMCQRYAMAALEFVDRGNVETRDLLWNIILSCDSLLGEARLIGSSDNGGETGRGAPEGNTDGEQLQTPGQESLF